MGDGIRLGALISGGGSNLQAIMDACESGGIDGTVAVVGSDTPGAYGLERAASRQIPTFVVDYRSIIRSCREAPETVRVPEGLDLEELVRKQAFFGPETDPARIKDFLIPRVIAEARLLDAMAPYPIDLLVLAGFMRNLTPYFIDRFNIDPEHPRIMNIHPALLPAFPGVDGYGDTFRYGCKVGGCTVHFIDYGEDSGPIIGQRSFQITSTDTIDSVRKRGLALEWALYPECIRLFAENRLKTVRMSYPLENGGKMQRRVVHIA